MKFNEILNSPSFFNVFIKNDKLFDSLKNKFPEILADLVSSRNNPNCSCKNRVLNYLTSKLDSESNFFSEIIETQEVKDLIKSQGNINVFPQRPPMNASIRNYGKVFEIDKTEKSWKDLCARIYLEYPLFRSFSLIEKEDKLIVYVL